MRKGILSLALIMGLMPALAYAGPSLGKFHGLQFGQNVKAQLPQYKIEKSFNIETYGNPFDKKESCWQNSTGNPREMKCCLIYFFDSLTMITIGDVTQDSDKLVSLDFRTRSNNFASLAELLREKYGAPDVDRDSPWQSQGGKLSLIFCYGVGKGLNSPSKHLEKISILTS